MTMEFQRKEGVSNINSFFFCSLFDITEEYINIFKNGFYLYCKVFSYFGNHSNI